VDLKAEIGPNYSTNPSQTKKYVLFVLKISLKAMKIILRMLSFEMKRISGQKKGSILAFSNHWCGLLCHFDTSS